MSKSKKKIFKYEKRKILLVTEDVLILVGLNPF